MLSKRRKVIPTVNLRTVGEEEVDDFDINYSLLDESDKEKEEILDIDDKGEDNKTSEEDDDHTRAQMQADLEKLKKIM